MTPEHFPRNEHGHLPAVCSILLTQLSYQPSFFQYRSKNNINCKNGSGQQINIRTGTKTPQQSNTPTIPWVPDMGENPITMKWQTSTLLVFTKISQLVQAEEISHVIHLGACIEHESGINEQNRLATQP